MKPRVTVITLDVDGPERFFAFYRDGLGLAKKGVAAIRALLDGTLPPAPGLRPRGAADEVRGPERAVGSHSRDRPMQEFRFRLQERCALRSANIVRPRMRVVLQHVSVEEK